jgi:pimeloyl-ACP methyl ester carboxylesterase
LLHGFPDSLRTWDRVIDALKSEHLRFLVPHLRGFGGSRVDDPDALSGQTAALAQDVLDFADAFGLDRFMLVGHDWGARTAYSVAVLAPQRLLGLVTLSTPYLMFEGGVELRLAGEQVLHARFVIEGPVGLRLIIGQSLLHAQAALLFVIVESVKRAQRRKAGKPNRRERRLLRF